MSTFRERLRYARERFGLSQAALADRIGLSRGVVFNLENRDCAKQPIVIEAICRELNINQEWLLDGVEPMEPDNERAKILNDLYQACSELSEAQQLCVLDFIELVKKHQMTEQKQTGTRRVDDIISDIKKRQREQGR